MKTVVRFPFKCEYVVYVYRDEGLNKEQVEREMLLQILGPSHFIEESLVYVQANWICIEIGFLEG